jgi:hypothetical protein
MQIYLPCAQEDGLKNQTLLADSLLSGSFASLVRAFPTGLRNFQF